MKNLIDAEWKVKVYSSPYALANIDIVRPGVGRWTYHIMIGIYESATGVDGNGTRACGSAEACVISSRPEPKREYRLVEIGETIVTPFGNYRIEWQSQTNFDHLKLVEITGATGK